MRSCFLRNFVFHTLCYLSAVSTRISSIGAVPNQITKNLTDEFYSKSVVHRTSTQKRRISDIMSDHSLSS